MKYLITIVSLLLLLLPQTSSAQTPVAIEGLEVIAERQYAPENAGPINTSADGVILITARVYLFEGSDAAESTWETLVAAQAIEDDLPEDDDSFQYEKTELEDVGDRAVALNLSAEISDSETGVFRTIIVQHETMIVSVNVIAGSQDAADSADAIAVGMIERESGDGESTYDGTGASTGGVWDVFPPEDADELDGLVAIADKETRPAE